MAETIPTARAVEIVADGATLHGDLAVPDRARGIVVFAHGSGSSRHSARNRFVAATLREAGLGTLLMDLLTEAEERTDVYTREHRFDIALLARRVTAAVDWLAGELAAPGKARGQAVPPARLGLFGASTGAAAALMCAAKRPGVIGAVVSRGGRPDLAGGMLGHVTAPTLLIVGGHDDVVIELNQKALEVMTCVKRLEIVPGATHLFEEPGTLDQVARLAAGWFAEHLKRP
jgi:putative phosphoribosyl transferase